MFAQVRPDTCHFIYKLKNGYSRIIRLDGQCVLRSVAGKIKTAFVKLLSFLVSVNKSIAHPYSLISWRSLVSL